MSPVSIRVGSILAGGVAALLASSALATSLQELPHGARAGECYGRTATPPVYRTVRDAVPQPPRISWRDVPAVYRTVSRQVLVTPGRVDYETIPAVMGTREHWVEHPGPDRVVETPPVYRWVEQRVMVSPAHLVWKRGTSAAGFGEGDGDGVSVQPTGEVMCRVLIPARYAMRRVRVLVTPGRTCVEKGPATRERVVERYEVQPARVVPHPVAPVYRNVSERVLVTPARRDRVEIPQPPRDVERKVLVTPARSGWSRIACKPPSVAPVRYVRPAPPPVPLAPHRGHQCHVHTVCKDVPASPPPAGGYQPDYAQPKPGAELYGAPLTPPRYHAPSE